MSKIALEGNASGTGTFTLASPNSSTDRTLTLPDASGVIDRLNRAGNVLQVVSTFPTANFSTTSATMVDVTGYSATITPTSATSRILLSFGFRYGNSSSAVNGFRILRDATALSLGADNGNALGNIALVNTGNFMDTNLIIEDTPNTTSAVTYKLQVQTNTGTLRINERADGNGNNRYGYFILTEIAA